MESPITLSADLGMGFFLAIGVVYAVQAIKWVFEIIPWTGTNRIPGWSWVIAALVVSCLVCWLLKVDQLAKLFSAADITLGPPWSYLGTGLAIGVSSNVIFAVTKPLRKKIRTSEGKVVCLPAGEDVVPEAPVEQPAQQPEVIITPEPINTPENKVDQPDVLIKVGDNLVTPDAWHKATLLSHSIVNPDFVALDIGPDAKIYPVDK